MAFLRYLTFICCYSLSRGHGLPSSTLASNATSLHIKITASQGLADSDVVSNSTNEPGSVKSAKISQNITTDRNAGAKFDESCADSKRSNQTKEIDLMPTKPQPQIRSENISAHKNEDIIEGHNLKDDKDSGNVLPGGRKDSNGNKEEAFNDMPNFGKRPDNIEDSAGPETSSDDSKNRQLLGKVRSENEDGIPLSSIHEIHPLPNASGESTYGELALNETDPVRPERKAATPSVIFISGNSSHTSEGIDDDGTHDTTAPRQKNTFNISAAASAVDLSPATLNQTAGNTSEPREAPCYSDYLSDGAIASLCEGKVWSCEGRCGQFRHVPCSCHPNCPVYRTCCHDFHTTCVWDQCKMTELRDTTPHSTTPLFGPLLHNFPGILVPLRNNAAHDSVSSKKAMPQAKSTPASTEVGTAASFLAGNFSDPTHEEFPFLRPSSSSGHIENAAPEEETPQGRCVKDIQARLVDYCPEETDPGSETNRLCTTQEPRQLMEITPVTDSATGLHFRNIHCHVCWWRYLDRVAREMASCRGPEARPADLPPCLTWKAQILMSYHSRPRNETSLSAFFEFILKTPAAIKWISPENYPYHSCNSSTDVVECPSCSTTRNGTFSHINKQCQSYFSYVSVTNRVYPNKFCALCQIGSKITHPERAVGKSLHVAFVREIQNLWCTVPDLSHGRKRFHDFSFSVTMSFSASEAAWVLENDNLINTDGVRTLPKGGQSSWKAMKCSLDDCRVLSCAHYSWSVDSRCLQHVIPITTTLRLCLLMSANTSTCSTQFSRFVDTPSALFLLALKVQALEVLLSLSPVFRNMTKEDVRMDLDLSGGYIFLHYWSPFDISGGGFETPGVFLDPEFVRLLGKQLLGRMQSMSFRGWMETCVGIRLYQVTTVEMSRVLNTCATDGSWTGDLRAASSADSPQSIWPFSLGLVIWVSVTGRRQT